MSKQLLRLIGIGCLVASAILYMTNSTPTPDASLQKELVAMQKELAIVKQELAISQTVPSKPAINENFTNGREFIVEAGTPSTELSKALEREKFIDDAAKFDAYLEENNYTDILGSGTFMLYDGMRFPDIARVLLDL